MPQCYILKQGKIRRNILAALNDPNIVFFFRFLHLTFKEANFKAQKNTKDI